MGRPGISIAHYPIYLPEGLGYANRAFRDGHIETALSEYRRLSDLGSNPARAVLAFLYICGVVTGQPDPISAEAIASPAAKAGYAYGQYVLAWAYWQQGRHNLVPRLFMRAALKKRFPPAVVDLGRWNQYWRSGTDKGNRSIERLYWLAHRQGHVQGLRLLAQYYAQGRRGRVKQVLGIILLPIALFRVVFQHLRDPFAERGLFFVPNRQAPFLNSKTTGRSSSPSA